MAAAPEIADLLPDDDYSNEEEEYQSQALVRPGPADDDDLSKPPTDGEQYLRRVIEEAKQYKLLFAENVLNSERNKNLPEVIEKEAEKSFPVSKDWQLSAVADFSAVRLNLETIRQNTRLHDKLKKSLPRRTQEEKWLEVCSFRTPGIDRSSGPSTTLCLAIPQITVWQVLAYIGDWLADGELSAADACRWVYCLLACLELPVGSEVYSSLRQIARNLINYRTLVSTENPESDELVQINLIVCIIGRYFEQADLADPFL